MHVILFCDIIALFHSFPFLSVPSQFHFIPMQEKNWAMGLWKFSSKVPKEDLIKFAEQWAAEDPKYLQLYVRKVSKDQNGIGFTYQLPEGVDTQTAHDEYFDKTSDILKRNFGNGLAGWDIASTVIVIK
jgi:hypothetical protein